MLSDVLKMEVSAPLLTRGNPLRAFPPPPDNRDHILSSSTELSLQTCERAVGIASAQESEITPTGGENPTSGDHIVREPPTRLPGGGSDGWGAGRRRLMWQPEPYFSSTQHSPCKVSALDPSRAWQPDKKE